MRNEFDNMNTDTWSVNLGAEIAFWRKHLLTWKDDPTHNRVKSNLPFQFREYCHGANEYDILDVGAGPISSLGNVWEGKKLNIKAIDPLADMYNSILSEYGIVPRVVTEKLDGEKLSDSLTHDSFDFAYSRNALDHSYNPLGCIDEILKVLKVSCYCKLETFVNEGTNANWHGLHQWDFYHEGETFFIADRDKNIINVNKKFKGRADIVCGEYSASGPMFYILIKKLP
jgi:hypothetical protein